jgi:hypothetical protein
LLTAEVRVVQSIGRLQEDVSLFAVLGKVQTLEFLVALDAEAHRQVEDL